MPLPQQWRGQAGTAAALPLAALLAACCGAGPAAARGADAPTVQDIAAQIKRQYDSVKSLHVKWRTTVDNVLLPLEIVEPYRSNFKAHRAEYEESDEEQRDGNDDAETAHRIAAIRTGPEAREGLAAFFAKRKPGWAP